MLQKVMMMRVLRRRLQRKWRQNPTALEPEPVRSTRPLIMVADYTETPGPVFRLTRFQSPRLWTVTR
ncbi:hypothetical protein PI124_g21388 [Phytophthora idaei]|nr:hypothetical protein PI124_g21388 [Phytophthora idaei]